MPIEVAPQEHNLRYLRVKRDKLGHVLHHQDLRLDDEPATAGAEHSPHDVTAATHGDGTLVAPGGSSLVADGALGADARVAVVASRYHSEVIQRLLDGALEAVADAGIAGESRRAAGARARSSSACSPVRRPSRAATRRSRRSAA